MKTILSHLIEKYQGNVPRYTSYPTPDRWTNAPDPADLARISHGDLHKNGEIGGQSRMVRGANQNQPTISPCNRLLKANLNFKGIMAVV